MRKILLLSIALLLSLSAGAQAGSFGKAGVYEIVVNCDLDKAQLWSNLKRWVSVTFVSYKHTVDMEDKEAGSMVVKYNFSDDLGAYTLAKISAVLQVDVKDKKYRIRISDPSFGVKPNSRLDGDISWMSTSVLETAKAEMEAAQNLISGGITSFDDLQTTIGAYTTLRDRTPKYRKPKDEKKGKVNPLYQEYDKTVDFGERLATKYGYNSVVEIIPSLEKGMAYSNNF